MVLSRFLLSNFFRLQEIQTHFLPFISISQHFQLSCWHQQWRNFLATTSGKRNILIELEFHMEISPLIFFLCFFLHQNAIFMSVSMYDIEEVNIHISGIHFRFKTIKIEQCFFAVGFEFSTESFAFRHELLAVRFILASTDLLFWHIRNGSHWKCCQCSIRLKLVWISGWSA